MDQKSWETIGRVKGNGTTNQPQQYSFLDRRAKDENFYRLKQVDFDGDFEYSEIIYVSKRAMTVSYVYPNPVKQEFDLTGIDRNTILQLYLLKMNGERIELSTDATTVPASLTKGVYVLRAILPEGPRDFKLVKE